MVLSFGFGVLGFELGADWLKAAVNFTKIKTQFRYAVQVSDALALFITGFTRMQRKTNVGNPKLYTLSFNNFLSYLCPLNQF